MNIAVMGVIHPFSLPYLHDYLESLTKQKFTDFRLFLFGHKIPKTEIDYDLNKFSTQLDINYFQLDDKLSIPKSRETAISYIKKKKFDFCIFTDTDDFFHQEFVKSMVNPLIEKKSEIVFSDLIIYFSNNRKIPNYLQECNIPTQIHINHILDKNCLGLGHSGISLDLINHKIPNFPDDLIAVDWWFFSTLMIANKCSAQFIEKPLCFYRQHGNSIAGFLNLNEQKILRGIKVKLFHYKNLKEIDSKYTKYYHLFNQIYTKIMNPQEIKFKKQYIDTILTKFSNKRYLWWEYVLPLKNF